MDPLDSPSSPVEEKDLPRPTPPFLKFSALMFLLVLVLGFGLALFFLDRGKDLIYREKVKAGEIVLGYLARAAILPLLEDDPLRLNTLVQEAKQATGFAYAVILDGDKAVKSQTEEGIGAILKEIEPIQEPIKEGRIISQTYTLPSGVRVLNLSKPIIFPNKILGWVYLGLSLDLLSKEIRTEILPLVYKSALLGLVGLIVVMGAAFFLTRRLNGLPPGLGKSFLKKIIGLFSQPGTESVNSLNAGLSRVTRDQVTVLFAGMKGFRSYADARGPEGILEDLNEYLTITQKCILDYGGYVDRFVGGAVVGVFSSSPLSGDHTMRAINAALAMQGALGNVREKGNPLCCRVGIGISSGVVLFGLTGSQDKNGYTFIGESLKAAYSLNVMANPGEIVMSKDVYQSIEDFVSVEPLPPQEIGPRTEPWENFRLRQLLERKHSG